MPQLNWDELDFMTCLEVEPEVEEYETYHRYKVERHGLILNVIVKQYESLVRLSLEQFGVNTPLIEFDLHVRGPVQRIYDKTGEYLELIDCVFSPTRSAVFWMQGRFDKDVGEGPTVRIQIKPAIRLTLEDGA